MDEREPNLKWPLIIGSGAAILVLLASPSALFGTPDEVVNRQIAEEKHARACIAQYGPGEYSGKKPMDCAAGTYDVPATALSYPLARQ